jgi:hypothetical protein
MVHDPKQYGWRWLPDAYAILKVFAAALWMTTTLRWTLRRFGFQTFLPLKKSKPMA